MYYMECGTANNMDEAVSMAVADAKEKNESVKITYLNYDSERGTPDVVAFAYPCGCVKMAPGWTRHGEHYQMCNQHHQETNDGQ